MRYATLLLTAAVLATGVPRAARAQSPDDQLEAGVRAYQQLELVVAARALRQALAATEGADTLATDERTRALMFLFATESLRERASDATAAAVQLLRINPQYRPDETVFSPDLVNAFRDVQRSSRVTLIRAPSSVTLAPNDPAFTVRVVVSTPQQITVNTLGEDGAAVRTVFSGLVQDSIDVRVDARDSSGTPLVPGRYQLGATGRDDRGRGRLTRVPFEVLSVASLGGSTRARSVPGGYAEPRASFTAGAGQYASSSAFAGGSEDYAGMGLFGEGTLALGRLRFRANYGEANLRPEQNDLMTRQLVEGAAMVGLQTLPWLTLWAGPHARTYVTDGQPSERWLVWEVRLAAKPTFGAGRLAASFETWGVASANVDAADSFDRGLGGEGALAVRIAETSYWIGGSYRIEQARLEGNVRRENNTVAGVFLRMDFR